jgi:hypothetical protein
MEYMYTEKMVRTEIVPKRNYCEICMCLCSPINRNTMREETYITEA